MDLFVKKTASSFVKNDKFLRFDSEHSYIISIVISTHTEPELHV